MCVCVCVCVILDRFPNQEICLQYLGAKLFGKLICLDYALGSLGARIDKELCPREPVWRLEIGSGGLKDQESWSVRVGTIAREIRLKAAQV